MSFLPKNAPELVLVIILLIVIAAALVQVNENERFRILESRNRLNFGRARKDFKKIQALLGGQEAQKATVSGTSYWGPLTTSMFPGSGQDTPDCIDSFNDDVPNAQNNGAVRYKNHKGPYQVYTDGHGFWTLISRGPDCHLELSSATLKQVAASLSDSERQALLTPYFYDPTNGTGSAGDIVSYF